MDIKGLQPAYRKQVDDLIGAQTRIGPSREYELDVLPVFFLPMSCYAVDDAGQGVGSQ